IPHGRLWAVVRKRPAWAGIRFRKSELDDLVLVDHIEPRPRAAVADDVLHLVPLAHEPGQPAPGGGVLLAADPENTQPGVDKVLYLSWSSADSLVASDDDEISRRDRL